jgi:hypothetical protein
VFEVGLAVPVELLEFADAKEEAESFRGTLLPLLLCESPPFVETAGVPLRLPSLLPFLLPPALLAPFALLLAANLDKAFANWTDWNLEDRADAPEAVDPASISMGVISEGSETTTNPTEDPDAVGGLEVEVMLFSREEVEERCDEDFERDVGRRGCCCCCWCKPLTELDLDGVVDAERLWSGLDALELESEDEELVGDILSVEVDLLSFIKKFLAAPPNFEEEDDDEEGWGVADLGGSCCFSLSELLED